MVIIVQEKFHKMSAKQQNQNVHIYENYLSLTIPELMILCVLFVFVLIALLLCLDSHKCLQKLLEERKILEKKLQYLPSEDLTRVDPEPGENRVDAVMSSLDGQNCDNPTPRISKCNFGEIPERDITDVIHVQSSDIEKNIKT